ncbi:hypothetical protein M422DRAFT_274500 [Sphaerobolus stellatus SS14]|uniref:F-box domain-containing protein n=1 Tax=Sphaerobolus stellatus (strain SS14) TaxID=990650 RepID=A0A0C9UGV4_SPHS4|nr:hypothetical protein M422DRAFT_274500 [Sphaerobolus stellatus SS14]
MAFTLPAASMASMPNEIIADFFYRCQEYFPNTLEHLSGVDAAPPSPIEFDSTDSAFAPLVFTQVCRRWRGVATNTPRLWSQLFITGVNGISESLLSKFLENSGARPLDILFLSNRWIHDRPEESGRFLHTLNKNFNRIRSFITTDVRVHKVLPSRPTSSSILEVLWIVDGYNTLPLFINSNPLELTKIDLTPPKFLHSSQFFTTLPWITRLKSVVSTSMQLGMINMARFLARHSNLTECVVNYVNGGIPKGFEANNLPGATLSKLKYLRVSYGEVSLNGGTHVDNEYLSPLMASLQMPTLNTLTLIVNSSNPDSNGGDMVPNFPNGLLTCLTNSDPPIKKLVFIRVEISTESFKHLLRLVPHLESLTLAYFSNTERPSVIGYRKLSRKHNKVEMSIAGVVTNYFGCGREYLDEKVSYTGVYFVC